MQFGDIPSETELPAWEPINGKRALITGITGQDGSYLAELLLEKGYLVTGVIRRSSQAGTTRIDHLLKAASLREQERLTLCYGDMTDSASLGRIVADVRPEEIYNLAAQSHVQVSFDNPEYTGDATGLGSVRLLEACRTSKLNARIFQASSSEMFGNSTDAPQHEKTPFSPRSPYAAAKVYAFHVTQNYREAYDLFAVNGIFFNHESPRRGENFVTRKISKAAAAIAAGQQDQLLLGNLDAKRDWGYAKDYVEAMWTMLQADEPRDFVVATGESRSVREFCERAFARVGMPIQWRGSDVEEIGVNASGATVIAIDKRFYRATEVDYLVGDSSSIGSHLGWQPSVCFDQLVDLMVDADQRVVAAASR